jgi:hypothetical protein
MGTRSMIAIENPHSLAVKSIYCHWDGYLQHNGSLLEKHYSNSPKVNNLIALGDLSSLRPEIGEKHEFSRLDTTLPEEEYERLYGDMCTYYTRDRGEDAPYKHFSNVKEAVAYYDGSWCEYFYLFKYDEDLESGKWFYRTRENGRWKRLATALKRIDQKDLA